MISVMGCELKRQLSEPGAGACCESIAMQAFLNLFV